MRSVFGLLFAVFMSFSSARADVGHLGGEIAGEATSDSIILQSRLTAQAAEADAEILGQSGWARFHYRAEGAEQAIATPWIEAVPGQDYIIKALVQNLQPNTEYRYFLEYGATQETTGQGGERTFRTLPGAGLSMPVSFVHATCMNYQAFHFGLVRPWYLELAAQALGAGARGPYAGDDKALGYPALQHISSINPDFVIFIGDNVYYDAGPEETWARDLESMRYRWHRQLGQPRFLDLLGSHTTYWTKDDHDFRFNDGDNVEGELPTAADGRRVFLEQVPLADPSEPDPKTYRTIRVSRELQVWYLEGRDYRSPNDMPDGPDKTMWGAEQLAWMKRTIVSSDAPFKLIISPTPLIGPDRSTKNDNHANPDGFRTEGQAFLDWLVEAEQGPAELFFVVGDRHWQYHSIDPRGYEEFSSGSLSEVNAQAANRPGDFLSTDPDSLIVQPYASEEKIGGFLHIDVTPESDNGPAALQVRFMDELGAERYRVQRNAR